MQVSEEIIAHGYQGVGMHGGEDPVAGTSGDSGRQAWRH